MRVYLSGSVVTNGEDGAFLLPFYYFGVSSGAIVCEKYISFRRFNNNQFAVI